MPIPAVITDLNATIASNSPAGGEPPSQGDDYIRALSAFIRQTYDTANTDRTNLANTASSVLGDYLTGVKTSVTGSVATTQHQVNDERTSALQLMTSAQIAEITAGTAGAAAICSTALQAGMDGLPLITLPRGAYVLDKTLRVKNGTSRTSFRGDHRVRCVLQPNAASIAEAPMSVNAVIAIQDNNAHLVMDSVRFYASAAYTGVGIYCVEGGGSDATGQALFSGNFKNLWIDFPTTNTGFLTGAVQNTIFDTAVCENMKGIFTFQGVGSFDNYFRNFSLYGCYDQFMLQTADTHGSVMLSVDGVHAYNHMRGRLFDVQNWTNCTVNDVSLEPDAANLGSTGLFKFKDSAGLLVSNFTSKTRSGVPACAVGIEVNTVTGKFTNGQINADIGLKIAGTGAIDLEFVNVDFTACTTAALQFFAATTGTLRTRGCKFNNSTLNGILSTSTNALNWYSDHDEFLNAGLGGSASTRNITLASSGTIIMNRPRIGRNDGGAAAAYFVDASGSGTVEMIDPIWIGTPPTARFTGSQAVRVRVTQMTGFAPVTAATYIVDPIDRDITCNRAGTTTLTMPTAENFAGRELWVQTLQAQTVISDASNVTPLGSATPGTAICAATAGKWARLVSDGANWRIMGGN